MDTELGFRISLRRPACLAAVDRGRAASRLAARRLLSRAVWDTFAAMGMVRWRFRGY
jgi:hypothetical protein